jgi:hypothetical protein
MTALTFTADSRCVYLEDGPWGVRVDQQAADDLQAVFDRIGAVAASNSLHDACQRAGYIPTCSPIPRGPRLVADSSKASPQERVKSMLSASVAVGSEGKGAA